MRFTGTSDEGDTHTRASSKSLTSGFMVSTWKSYDNASQQTVMDKYEVEYKVDEWNNRSQWNYVGVNGQYERYWDYANFPYRFHAIAPYPSDPAGFILAEKNLKINAHYSAQSCDNGITTPKDNVAEPCLIAQVGRDTDGKDHDYLATDQSKVEINTSSTQKHREVWLPFHHLNSKVRFGLFTIDLWAIDNPLYIQDLVITAHSNDPAGFVTGAANYQVSNTDQWHINTGTSGFSGLERATGSYTLLEYKGGLDEKSNLSKYTARNDAFTLGCPNGLMQIPQENVTLTVSFNLLSPDGTIYKSFQNCIIRLEEDGTSVFQWYSGFIHTYYLILDTLGHLELEFTATLSPWEDISGSLSTDLEK